MLRIEIDDGRLETRLRLSGRISGDHLTELTRLLEERRHAGRRVILNLAAVTVAAREVIAFLVSGPGRDSTLEDCPSFLNEWIRSEKTTPPNRPFRARREEP